MTETLSKQEIKRKLIEARWETRVGQHLAKLYTGYHWMVDVNLFGGVCAIKNLTLHGDFGFVLHMDQLENDQDLQTVTFAGGELLERCNLPRTFRPEDFTERVDLDIRGNVIGDIHGA